MNSIKSRLLAFAILATLIPSVGLGLLSFWRYEDLIDDNATLELRTLVEHTGSELSLWVRERVNEVRALSTSNTVVDGLAAVAAPPAGAVRIGPRELELYLRSVQKKLDTMLELTVVDATGGAVASSAANPEPAKLPTPWSSAAVTDGQLTAAPRWDAARGTATLTVLVPVLSARNELLGALAVVLDLGKLRPRLAHVVRSSTAEVILLTPDGAPLFGTHGVAGDLAPLEPQAFARLRAHPGEPLTFIGHHQRPVIGVADAPEAVPIVVLAERDHADVYQAWLKSLQLFLALVAGLTLLVALVAYWLGRSIVRPLDRLIGAADRIADGDLAVQLRVANEGEIGHLTQVFNTMVDRLRHSREEVGAAHEALQEQNRMLETLSITDSLTGVYNRKKLDDILADQFARFRRSNRPFALLMLDLDNFKALNDTYGHLAGDEVLASLAAVLRRSVRAVDFVARYGGEEFVVVLVDTPMDAALRIAERIRSLVETPRLCTTNELISVTVSLGVTDSRAGDSLPEDVLARADRAMYAAKHAGRNKVRAT